MLTLGGPFTIILSHKNKGLRKTIPHAEILFQGHSISVVRS